MLFEMRKALLLFFAALLASSAYAQGRHEVNTFIGGLFGEYARMGGSGLFVAGLDSSEHEDDLYDLYEPHYSLKSGPVLTLNYHYFLNPYLGLGAQFSYGAMSGSRWYKIGNKPAGDVGIRSLSLLPELKACIPGPSHFRLYGKAAVGLSYRSGPLAESPVGLAWEFVPLGAEWGGHKVYGNAELCWGSVVIGGRIGLGFRF